MNCKESFSVLELFSNSMENKTTNDRWLYIHNGNFDDFEANKIQVCQMCKAFLGAGKEVSLLSLGTDINKACDTYGLNEKIDIKLISPGKNPIIRSVRLSLEFLKIKNGFRFVYTRDLLVALVAKFFTNTFVILELHTVPPKLSRRYLLKIVYLMANYLVVISQGIKNDLTRLGFGNKKIIILPDAVDIESFEKTSNLNVPNFSNKKIILYAGSLKEWKGYETFLKSSLMFKNNNDVIFAILGGEEKQIEKLAPEYSNVMFLGSVSHSQTPKYLKGASVLILPNSDKFEISRKHSSPLKLFEYMASKKPIIASDLPSFREIVSEEEVLFFVPDDDKDLAQKISDMLKNSEFANKLATNAYRKVKKYTWIARANKIIQLTKN